MVLPNTRKRSIDSIRQPDYLSESDSIRSKENSPDRPTKKTAMEDPANDQQSCHTARSKDISDTEVTIKSEIETKDEVGDSRTPSKASTTRERKSNEEVDENISPKEETEKKVEPTPEELAKKAEEEAAEKKLKAEESARSLKDAGNTFYKAQKYAEAIRRYTEALDVCPKDIPFYATILGNRSAGYLMSKNSTACQNDCIVALKIDKSNTKVAVRLSTAYIAEAKFDKAIQVLDEIGNPKDEVIQAKTAYDKIVESFQKDESAFKVFQSATAMQEKIFNSAELEFMICQSLLDMGNYNRVQTMTQQMLRTRPQDVRGLVLRAEGACRANMKFPTESLFPEPLEKCIKSCKQALASDPDCKEARDLRKKLMTIIEKVKEAKNLTDNREFAEAIIKYNEIIDLDPKNKALSIRVRKDRATAHLRLKDYKSCIEDCRKCIAEDTGLKEAYEVKARAHEQLGELDEVVNVYKRLFEIDRTEATQTKLNDAIFKQKKANRPDLYKELGVISIASQPEIRKGYREQAKECHPDKTTGMSDEEKKKMEEQFKTLTYYYELLTDPTSKELYDQGHDLDHIKEKMDQKKAEANFKEQHGARMGGMGGMPGGFPFRFG